MLKEFKKVRQDNDSFRRYFTDDMFDLYIWYNKDVKEIEGFQIIYDKREENLHAFTWEKNEGTFHSGIDNEGWYNPSPILFKSELANKIDIAREFVKRAKNIDDKLVKMIANKIVHYRNPQNNK